MTHPIHPDPVFRTFTNWCASVDALSQDWEAWKARHPEVFQIHKGREDSPISARGYLP